MTANRGHRHLPGSRPGPFFRRPGRTRCRSQLFFLPVFTRPRAPRHATQTLQTSVETVSPPFGDVLVRCPTHFSRPRQRPELYPTGEGRAAARRALAVGPSTSQGHAAAWPNCLSRNLRGRYEGLVLRAGSGWAVMDDGASAGRVATRL